MTPLLATPEQAARVIGRQPVLVVGSGAARGRCRRRRPAPRLACPTCSRTPQSLAIMAPSLCPLDPRHAALPAAAGCQATGRQSLAEDAAMTKPSADYKHVSILWAASKHAEELARLHAPLFSRPGTLPASGVARSSRLHRFHGARRRAAGDGRLHPRPARRGRGRNPHARCTRGLAAPRHRAAPGRGPGRAARKAEARRLYLEVAASNAAALRLYQKLGFAEIGRRKGYYERPGSPPEDAINLSLAL